MARRSFERGELLLVVLRLLEQRPKSEGEVLDELHERLGDAFSLSSGEALIALEALEAEGLVEVAPREGPPAYRATGEGAEALRRRADAPVLARMDEARRPQPMEHPGTSALERVAILFTDVVGSTELLDRLGDEASHAVRRRHFALLRRAVEEHRGREVKSLGDGLMVAFADARPAVECGLSMQRAVTAAEDPLQLRVGIASGEAVREDDDYFGRPVIVARRLCDAARPGHLLVSEPPPEKIAGSTADPVESLELKGLSQPVEASAVRVLPFALSA